MIGVAGDVLDIKDGHVVLNGKILEESYVKGNTNPGSVAMPITIPENAVFVMGDNREVSLDSRNLGVISVDSIDGRAVFRIWPLNEFESIK